MNQNVSRGEKGGVGRETGVLHLRVLVANCSKCDRRLTEEAGAYDSLEDRHWVVIEKGKKDVGHKLVLVETTFLGQELRPFQERSY